MLVPGAASIYVYITMIRALPLLVALLAAPVATAAPREHGGALYYFGDLHVHTGLSFDGTASDVGAGCDGNDCGAVATVVEDARTVFDLDFVSLTDHGNGWPAVVDEDAWAALQQQLLEADAAHEDFVGIIGVEVFRWKTDGTLRDHRNVYLFGDDDQLQGLSLDELAGDEGAPFVSDQCGQLWDWLDDLVSRRGDALLIPHHPAVDPPASTDWTCQDPRYNPVVENYSQHGNSQIESYDGSFDAPGSAERPGGTVERALDPAGYGIRIGIIGGTDSHDTRPGSVCDRDPKFMAHEVDYGGGLTVVILDADETFDRRAIYDALVARRTMSTSGPRIPVGFRAVVDGEVVATIGQEVEADPDRQVVIEVDVPEEDGALVEQVLLRAPVGQRFEMEREDDGVWRLPLTLPADATTVVYPEVVVDGATYWAARGVDCDDGGEDQRELLWTSPIWLDATASDEPGGCSCRSSDPTPLAVGFLPLLYVAVVRRWVR